jgi:hypothetical protein
MAIITFNGPAKTITVGYDGAITEVSATELYSEWKLWLTAGNAQYPQAFSESVGGNDLGGGVALSAYYFLRNDLGWRIVPENGYDFTLAISGDIYPQDANTAFVTPPAGDYTVLVSLQRSAASYVVAGGGGGGSFDPDDVADAVWDKSMSSYTTPGTFGDRVRRLLWR